jgi:hypothetical protein
MCPERRGDEKHRNAGRFLLSGVFGERLERRDMAKEYIEREALIRYAEKQEVIIKGGTSIAEAMRIQGNVFRRCVETCPAADVVEVVHGEWITKGNHFPYCSECETLALQKEDRGGWRHYHQSKFCPHCGAKMDGERKEV